MTFIINHSKCLGKSLYHCYNDLCTPCSWSISNDNYWLWHNMDKNHWTLEDITLIHAQTKTGPSAE